MLDALYQSSVKCIFVSRKGFAAIFLKRGLQTLIVTGAGFKVSILSTHGRHLSFSSELTRK